MGFSPLANMKRRIPDGGRFNYRQSKISGVTYHHNMGVNSFGEASNPNREVSAQYWITNEGDILPNVDENLRAFTTGAAGYPEGAKSDHRNITMEISNSPEGVRTGTWAISDAAMLAVIRLTGDIFKRHGLGPVKRGLYHGVAVHKDFVATECPGGYIMGNLTHIISQAEIYRVTGGTSNKKWTVTPMKTFNPEAKLRQIIPADGKYHRVYIDKNKAVTIASGDGDHITRGQVNVKGTPGDPVEFKMAVEHTDKDGKYLGAFSDIGGDDGEILPDGTKRLSVSTPYSIAKPPAGQSNRTRMFVKNNGVNPMYVSYVRSVDAKL